MVLGGVDITFCMLGDEGIVHGVRKVMPVSLHGVSKVMQVSLHGESKFMYHFMV